MTKKLAITVDKLDEAIDMAMDLYNEWQSWESILYDSYDFPCKDEDRKSMKEAAEEAKTAYMEFRKFLRSKFD